MTSYDVLCSVFRLIFLASFINSSVRFNEGLCRHPFCGAVGWKRVLVRALFVCSCSCCREDCPYSFEHSSPGRLPFCSSKYSCSIGAYRLQLLLHSKHCTKLAISLWLACLKFFAIPQTPLDPFRVTCSCWLTRGAVYKLAPVFNLIFYVKRKRVQTSIFSI